MKKIRSSEKRAGHSILVADDNQKSARRISSIMKDYEFNNVRYKSKIGSFSDLLGFDIVLLDIVWPEGRRPSSENSELFGFSAMEYLREREENTHVVLFSAHLFDLYDLQKIEKADGYFKSSDEPRIIIDVLDRVLD